MGIKNRTGCCCGGSTPCLNVATICQGYIERPNLYLKNGVVTDANGSWPLKQPTASIAYWESDLIPFTTDKWTSGDCAVMNGVAYYQYRVGFTNYNAPDIDSIGMYLQVLYAAQQCGPVRLYTGDKTSNYLNGFLLGTTKIECDPIKAVFTITSQAGLSPPSPSAVVTFDIDDASTRQCGCRDCAVVGTGAGFSPVGDAILNYSIDFGGEKLTGSVVLKKTLDFINAAWIGNVDAWIAPSCTNPSGAPGGFNVMLNCNALTFLKWCVDGSAGPHTKLTSAKASMAEFDLIDPGSANTYQGSVSVVDSAASGFDGVCCDICVLPKKSLGISMVITSDPSPIPNNCPEIIGLKKTGTVFNDTFDFYANPFAKQTYLTPPDPSTQWVTYYWRIKNPVVVGDSGPPFYISNSPYFGSSGTYDVYYGCNGLAYGKRTNTGAEASVLTPITYSSFYNDPNEAVSPTQYNYLTCDYTCDPLHSVKAYTSPVGYCTVGAPNYQYGTAKRTQTVTVDEKE